MTVPEPVALAEAALAESIAAWLRSHLPAGAHLRCDSREVKPGDAFFAWRGEHTDGRMHCADALGRGAAALLEEWADPGGTAPAGLETAGPDRWVRQSVTGLRGLAGEIASRYYGSPATRLQVVAVTGTNGKTTCTQWIAQGLARLGRKCGVIGTLGYGPAGEVLTPFGLTMPDALSVHRMLAEIERSGAQAVAMEATSIGLAQGRLDGVSPSVAVFTNLTRDHLDYHGSFEAYARSKLRLFERPGLGRAVVNADDPFCTAVLSALSPNCEVIAYGQARYGSVDPRLRHLIVQQVTERVDGWQLRLGGDFGQAELLLPVAGRFNVDNALAAASTWLALGIGFEAVLQRLSSLEPVTGRMQRVGGVDGPLAVVDYAHTPDALEKTLGALRGLARVRGGRLICVFGAGGDRDRGKRPLMGAVAERLADQVVLTSDNPRSEVPEAIIAEIAQGLSRPAARIEPDRGRAIESALMDAQATDLVLIAGKGHECWQEIGGERLPFSDLEQASRTLARWAAQSHARSLTGTHQSAPRSAELGLPEPTDPPMRGLFTLRQAQGWLSSSALHCAGDVWVSEVVTDSRRVVPGCLFVALTGERFDGHDFIAQAQTQGAAAVIFERWRPGIALPALHVPDARRALSEIACGWRKQFNVPLASVAGSNGKTTVKEMLASIGRAAVGADAVLWSHGNDNNDIGVPQTLLRLREHHRLAVLELGMNHPGELAGLAATAQPTVALVNNAQREHQEFIAGTEASARENASSFAFLAEPGTAVFPGDDPVHSPIWREMSAASSRLQFGLVDTFDQRDPLVRVCALREAQADGFTILVEHQAIEVRLAIAGAHNVRNALAAAACAHAMGVDAAAIRAGLEAFRPVAGRLAERQGPHGSRLIDDTYNANPDSVRAAIDVLAASGERSILILGDMGEVGMQGPQWHVEVGAYARDRGIALLLALGEATRASVDAFGAAGRHFETVEALVADAALRIDTGTVTLVKGSRFMRMERVVAALAAGEAH